MKLIRKFVATLLMALTVVSIASMAHAQTFQLANMIVTTPCTSVPITGVSANLICIDSSSGLLYYPGASGMTAINSGGSSSSTVLNGSVSGATTLKASATTTSYTFTFKSAVPAQGDVLDFSNGTGQMSSLVDVAVGQVLTSGGVGAVPVYSASPSVTSVTSTGVSGINATAGGVISSAGGALPTATCSGGATGVSLATGSTNNRGALTTSSSASTNCTITWSAAGTWPQAPFCVFTDANSSVTPAAYSAGACGTSTCVVDFASATSKVINYLCM